VDRISQWRRESRDKTILSEFEWLAQEIMNLDRAMVRDPVGGETSREDAREVLGYESQRAIRT
jgi:hypothetical protein